MKKILVLLFVSTFIGCKCLSQIPPQYLYIDENCQAVMPDYRGLFDFTDNCAVKDTVQLPSPGTILSIVTNPNTMVEIIIRDYSDNIAATAFNVIIIDTIPPIITPKTQLLGHLSIYPNIGGSKLRATPVIMRGSGMLKELSGYHKGFESGNMILALYSDKDGKPYKLMATTGEVLLSNKEGWQISPVTESIRLNEGQELWIAFITDQVEVDQGFMAGEIDYLSDVSAHAGDYTGEMPMEFGESSQWSWGHNLHLRYSLIEDKPVQILAEDYLDVEQYINTQIQGYVDDFNWSTAAIDTVFQKPKCIPIGAVQ